MKIKTILLTGDDGYNSIGTRLLIHALKDNYTLQIAGTRTQQSGVGSKISIHTGFEWGTDTVDEVPAVWVDGTPADAIEFSRAYFTEPFDLVISGINWGGNLGAGVASSGTLGGALRCLMAGMTKKAIAFSWDLPAHFYTMKHTGADDLEAYLAYPTAQVLPLLKKAIKDRFWGASLLNINFPAEASSNVVMTEFTPLLADIYEFDPAVVDATKESGHFKYRGDRVDNSSLPMTTDTGAMNNGYISITPCRPDYLDEAVYKKVADTSFSLT